MYQRDSIIISLFYFSFSLTSNETSLNCSLTLALTLIEYIITITAEYPKMIPHAINTEFDISPIGGDTSPIIIKIIPAAKRAITVI